GSSADRAVTLVDAVMASTAAPSFFPSATVAGSSFIDGGLWSNNPALMALLDAKALGADDPRLVSLGTGRLFWGRSVGFGAARGLIGWGSPLVVLMMSAQSQGVDGYVRRLLPEDRYLRVDPALPKELAGLDEPEAIPALLVRATEAARSSLADFRDLG
ncbi:patatin, partial [bacterium]